VLDQNSIIAYENLLNNYSYTAKNTNPPYHKEWWKRYFTLKEAFADVQYIFASTIHKLQGSTYNTVHIDLASLINNNRLPVELKYRLAYVAITRARKQIKILY